ncbi:PspC domain-containing protein [Mucilaginibacter limnophilus]|uniref:PspC domain-containing protein n=1 Tax=Mucilaginibacter limnophilus TaxID=1932778 RepID=A0A437MQS5_9SPHI|nr:PspC domain-containing protein [Mucilaginibacter limnophilus]RVT99989.1 PspC domain-containing protein [Mucilaginibacter limnophilus]
MEKKLYRDEQRKKIGGVCAGVAEYFGVDVSIVRVIFLAAFIFKGAGLVLYGILWIVLPKKPFYFNNPEVDYRVPPMDPFNPFKSTSEPNFTMPNYGKPAEPFGQVPAKKPSKAGVIVGTILIIGGFAFLLENFNLIPDIDFDIMWPMILVGAGIAFIMSGAKRKPWDKQQWDNTTTTAPADEQPIAEEPKSEDNKNDNPTTI